jgi:hypothetical protein
MNFSMKDCVLKGFLFSFFVFFLAAKPLVLEGQENIALIANSVLTSYVSGWENLDAVNDGYDPASSMDESHDTYGNWQAGVTNKWNWVQYNFDSYYAIDQSNVYWWTDQADSTSTVGVQMPYDCYLQYWDMVKIPGVR